MRALLCFLSVAVLLSGCGKKGPLVYPDMLVPAAPADVSAQQAGTSMKLSFVLPSRDRAGRPLSGLAGVRIVRRDEPSGQLPGCPSCTTDFSHLKTLELDSLPSAVQRFGSLVVLLDGDVQAGRNYSYRFTAFTKDNQEGFASPLASVAMVAAPPSPVLQVISQPTEISLEFVAQSPANGTVAGYNIYRTVKGEPLPLLPLNREPVNGNRFTDQAVDRGTTYVYGVRSVVRLAGGGRAESPLSNEAEGRLKDDE